MNLIETQERTFKEFKDAVSQANEKVDKIYSNGVDAIDKGHGRGCIPHGQSGSDGSIDF